MEETIHFIPDASLTEGSTTVHNIVRMARTQPEDPPPVSSSPPPERSVAMVQRQPQYVPEPFPQHEGFDLAPDLLRTPLSGVMPPAMHEALDRYEDDLVYVEEVTRGAGLSQTRMFLATDQMTTSALELSYRRREGIGFANADEKELWMQGRRTYLYDMSLINIRGTRALGGRLREALDHIPEPSRRSKIVAWLRDGN